MHHPIHLNNKQHKKTVVTELEKEDIRRMVLNYFSIGQIAKTLKRSKSTIHKYIKIMGLRTFKPKSLISTSRSKRGRKPAIFNSSLCGEVVKDFIIKNEQNGINIQSAKTLRNMLVSKGLISTSVSLSSIRRYCKSWGICFGNSQVCPGLSEHNVLERLLSVSHNLFLNYKYIIFSDESMIRLNEVKTIGWRIRGKTYITEQYVKGNAGIMVWGAFSEYGFTDLMVIQKSNNPKDGASKGINSVKYCNFLQIALPPLMNQHPLVNNHRQCYFLQDNASIHKSKYTTQFLKDQGWNPVRHPPFSPDLNPIEKVWGLLKQKISIKKRNYKSLDNLEKAAKRCWKEIMKDPQTRHQFAFRYREAMIACLFSQGDYVLDNNIKKIRRLTDIKED